MPDVPWRELPQPPDPAARFRLGRSRYHEHVARDVRRPTTFGRQKPAGQAAVKDAVAEFNCSLGQSADPESG
jgi:hypothetical protein